MVQFVQENWEALAAGVALLLAVAGVAVKFTKTTKDDEVVAKITDLADDFLPTVKVEAKSK